MKALKIFMSIFAGVAIIFIGLLVIATLTEYDPPEEVVLSKNTTSISLDTSSEYVFFTWNIGYCGLGENMDFFYDGGKRVRDTEEATVQQLNKITNGLLKHEFADFILLQEVDMASKRSYYIDEMESISEKFPIHTASFAVNYDVPFVPVPWSNPMGRVKSGIATLSKNIHTSATRYSFGSSYSWPTYIFMLDRCFLVNRYPVETGKELIVINTHNSAFDDGSLKQKEMETLRLFITHEYAVGNYVVVGGDWNQLPPGFSPGYTDNAFDPSGESMIDADYLPSDWQWVFDADVPSNRSLQTNYKQGETLTRVLDFFLISPNVTMVSRSGIHLNFEDSDHNPLLMTVHLQ